jgi:hypothetical protein
LGLFGAIWIGVIVGSNPIRSISDYRIVQCTTRKTLLLTGESLLLAHISVGRVPHNGSAEVIGSNPIALISFNHRKSNYLAGAWWIEEWMWLSKKRTKTMAYSSAVEHPAVDRNVAGSNPAMPVTFVVIGGDCGLREIN